MVQTEIDFYGKKYFYKNWNGRRWLKLLHHNFEAAGGFVSESEALSSNNPNRYSILSELNDALKFNGTFEFHLEYPTYKIHWIQNDNPITLDGSKYESAPGLLVYRNATEGFTFKGLGLSKKELDNKISTLLDGNIGSSIFYYAVGMYNSTQGSWYSSGIPGAKDAEKRVTLWVRVPNYFGNVKTICSSKSSNHWLFFMLVLFVCS